MAHHIWDRIKWHNCPRLFITPKYPCHLEVEASAACQMKCPMCAQGKMFEKGLAMGNMKMELYKKIVDEIHKDVHSIKLQRLLDERGGHLSGRCAHYP